MTKEALKKISELACIAYDDGELDALTEDFDRIFLMLDKIKQCPTDDVELPVLAGANALRPDTVLPSMPREDLLARAPKTEAGCIVAPRSL